MLTFSHRGPEKQDHGEAKVFYKKINMEIKVFWVFFFFLALLETFLLEVFLNPSLYALQNEDHFHLLI